MIQYEYKTKYNSLLEIPESTFPINNNKFTGPLHNIPHVNCNLCVLVTIYNSQNNSYIFIIVSMIWILHFHLVVFLSLIPEFLCFRLPLSRKLFMMSNPESTIPRPNIITPNVEKANIIEKFLMMYTCKKCSFRNAQMV